MSLNIIFWVLMVIFGFYGGWAYRDSWGYTGPTWILLALLGWKVYPIALN